MQQSDITQHLSRQFNAALEDVRNKTLEMGGLVEQHVTDAVQCFVNGDIECAEAVAHADYKVNSFEVAIDEKCAQILALRHPVAGDLRLVMMIIKTITDLERIGDEAKKIARLAIRLAGQDQPVKLTEIRHLGDHVRHMLHDALDAYARMDVEAAMKVIHEDTKVDDEYEATVRHLMTFMIEDPRYIKRVLDVLWCARAMERIGDHAKNIAEYVVYLVHGKDIRHVSLAKIEQVLRT